MLASWWRESCSTGCSAAISASASNASNASNAASAAAAAASAASAASAAGSAVSAACRSVARGELLTCRLRRLGELNRTVVSSTCYGYTYCGYTY